MNLFIKLLVSISITINSLLLYAFFSIPFETRVQIFSLIIGNEGTRQAPWYDDVKFTRVQVGMSYKEVISLLGYPMRGTCKKNSENMLVVLEKEDITAKKFTCLGTWPDTSVIYAHQGSPEADYRIRGLGFKNGKVSEIIKRFEMD